MSDQAQAPGTPFPPFPPFPRALFQALARAAEGEVVLRLGLWNGETVSVRRVVQETDDGILGEAASDGRPGDGRGPVWVAVPWHAVARVEAAPEAPRIPRGFVPPGER